MDGLSGTSSEADTREAADAVASGLRGCPDCGLLQHVPAIGPGDAAICLRCDAVLSRHRRDSLTWTRVLAITGLLLYAVALFLPFMAFSMRGRTTNTTLLSAADSFASSGAWELAGVLWVTIVILPAVKLGVLLLVAGGLALPEPPRWLHQIFRWYERLSPWAMIEVYLIGVFVAYTRLTEMATVIVGPAGYVLAALMLVMVAADVVLDPEEVWEALDAAGANDRDRSLASAGRGRAIIGCSCCHLASEGVAEGDHCPRCGTTLRSRKPASLARTWALVIAAAILYLPANMFPILTVVSLGRGTPATIIGGVIELIHAQMIPIALLVFVASITVPMLKLVGLVLMLVTTQLGSDWRLRDRTRLYRVVDVIGRWSMIDVFMLSVLVSLVHLGFVGTVTPNIGAVCFAAVVILTMLAARSFDPRLMWDAAEAAASAPDQISGGKIAGQEAAG